MRRALTCLAFWVGALFATSPHAQTVPPQFDAISGNVLSAAAVLTVDSEALFAQSRFGQRVSQELAAEESVLMAENRRIQAELTEEERVLTARRATMDAKAFRAVADAFDARVVKIRTEQDQKSANIIQQRQQEEDAFIRAASPVLTELMREAGASVILDRREILLSDPSVDITEIAIQRLNLRLGDGIRPQADSAED
ncbi:OmpH family outer membrane protein [Shimia sp.]|uniref:OmpH family outer membrane protein n=1 Tax=Shimia sp. TaxID=1954381 RepID=UPI003B8B9271